MKTENKDLVHIDHGKVFTDSLIIASQFGKEPKHVNEKIKQNLNSEEDEIKHFSRSNFRPSDYKTSRGKIVEKYDITEDGFMELAMSFKGEKAHKIRIRFIQEFRKVINELNRIKFEPGRKEALKYKRDAHTPMMDMLTFTREGLEKETTLKDFSNENRFCNRALTGKWETINEAELDIYDTRLLEAIRKHNTLLISRYPAQKPERKEAIKQFVIDYKIKHPRLLLIQ